MPARRTRLCRRQLRGRRPHDGGGTWQQISDGLPGSWVRSLALRGTTVYAKLDEGIYRLSPGAATWSPWNDGLPVTNGMQSLRATADALYLATHEGGVCHLDCSDSTWVFINDGLWDDNVDGVVEIDQTLYAGTMGSGLFRLDSQSASWWHVGDGLWNGWSMTATATMSSSGPSAAAPSASTPPSTHGPPSVRDLSLR